MLSRIAIFAISCLLILNVKSQLCGQLTSTWSGSTGVWSDAAEWSTTNYPDNGNGALMYDAVITAGTATMDLDITIEALLHSGGVIDSNGMILTLNDASNWSGGAWIGGGETDFLAGLILDGTTKSLNTGHIVNNSGTALWSSGSFNSGNGGTINNLLGATFETNFDGVFNFNLGGVPSVLNNDGVFTKSGGVGASVFFCEFHNNGVVNVNSGTLQLSRAGISTGDFFPNAGATLRFFSGHDLQPGSNVAGVGEVRFSSGTVNISSDVYDIDGTTTIDGGTAVFNVASETEILSLNNGGRSGPATLTVNTLADWTGGSLGDSGTTNSMSNLELLGSTKTLHQAHTLNNFGTAVWSSGNFNSGTGGTLHNQPGATFETNFDGLFSFNLGGIPSAFNNGGVFTKSGGTGATVFSSEFHNDGVVNINSGTLRLSRSGNSTGDFVSNAGATLRFFSAHELLSGSSVSGLGDVRFSSGTVNVDSDVYDIDGATLIDGGTASFNVAADTESLILSNGNRSGPATLTVDTQLTWTGGSFGDGGTTNSMGDLDLSGGVKTIHQSHTLNNFDTALWSAGNFNSGTEGTIHNHASATFETDFDGVFNYNLGGLPPVFNNDGVFTKSGGAGSTILSCEFNNDGAVNINSGTLQLSRPGNSSGDFVLNAGTELHFSGGHGLLAKSTITGAGDVRFSNGTSSVSSDVYDVGGTTIINGGTAAFHSVAETESLSLSNGTRSGPGTLTVNSQTSWTGGSLTEAGTTNSLGTLDLSGGVKTIHQSHTFNNSGTALWTAGNFNTGTEGRFNNLAGASFETNFDGVFNYNLGGLPALFNNQGTFSKVASAGTTSFNCDFANSGSVLVSSGTLQLTRGMSQTAGQTLLDGGNLAASQPIDIQAGRIGGNGTISANELNVTGGTVAPGASVGQITLDDTDLTLVNNSVIEIELNAVTGTPGSDWDFISSTGSIDFSEMGFSDGITIRLVTLDANGIPGPLPAFDANAQYSMTIAVADSITDFNCDLVNFDLSQFVNPNNSSFVAGVVQSGSNQELVILYNDSFRGDVNGDGVVNLLDVAPFIDAISSGTYVSAADVNCDGAVNLLDVDLFITLLAG